MARILGLFPSSLLAAREGMSANAFYRELRALGIAARRSEVLALYRISRSITARSADEPFRDIRQTPNADEIQLWPTRKATGFRQTVAVVYRERSTGHISQAWYQTKTDQPIPRETAIAQALNAYNDHAERYNQDLIGAIHTSAYQLVPFSEMGLPG